MSGWRGIEPTCIYGVYVAAEVMGGAMRAARNGLLTRLARNINRCSRCRFWNLMGPTLTELRGYSPNDNRTSEASNLMNY